MIVFCTTCEEENNGTERERESQLVFFCKVVCDRAIFLLTFYFVQKFRSSDY